MDSILTKEDPKPINNASKGHSIESNCGQYILKEYIKNVKKSFMNVLFKMENEDDCISCQTDDYQLDHIDFTTNVSKFKLFKATTQYNMLSYGKSNYMLKDSAEG